MNMLRWSLLVSMVFIATPAVAFGSVANARHPAPYVTLRTF